MSEEYTVPTPIKNAPSWRRKLRDLPGEPLGSAGDLLDGFTQHLRARPAAAKTLERYTTDTRQFDEFVSGAELTTMGRADIEKWVVHQIEINSPTTAASKFVSLQQFFKYVAIVATERQIEWSSPAAGMSPPVYEQPMIAVIPDAFLAKLIRDAERTGRYSAGQDRSFEDARDAAILRIFVDTGIRLAENTGLTLSDTFDLPLLWVIGKGKGKGPVRRQVRVGEKSERAVKKYLRLRRMHPQADDPALWLGKKGPLTISGVRQTITRRSLRLGYRINPHQFRHTFAHGWKSDPNRHDGDLMEVMGWRDVRSMHRYAKSAAAGRALEAQRFHGAPGDKI